MSWRVWSALVLIAAMTGCGVVQRDGSSGSGSHHIVRLRQPPVQAAHCFARNAQEHSSALIAEVTATREDRAQVIVRVKNGVTYATADMTRSRQGSTATITLMSRSSGGQSDLLDALVEGC